MGGFATGQFAAIAEKEMVCPAAVTCVLTCGDIAARTAVAPQNR